MLLGACQCMANMTPDQMVCKRGGGTGALGFSSALRHGRLSGLASSGGHLSGYLSIQWGHYDSSCAMDGCTDIDYSWRGRSGRWAWRFWPCRPAGICCSGCRGLRDERVVLGRGSCRTRQIPHRNAGSFEAVSHWANRRLLPLGWTVPCALCGNAGVRACQRNHLKCHCTM